MSWTPKNNFGDVLKKMEETRSIRHQTASSAVSFGSQDKGKVGDPVSAYIFSITDSKA
jgi:hypothetical protein